ncbi:MAG TPA: hypothetical protein GXX62_01380 [Alcaligenaceae bacterium]|nr:hypothetical protein [Alcaligenaceae bacterium]
MKQKLITISYCAISLICIIVAGYFGRKVPFAEQWPLYEALRTTAAIIFAVVGAWIAIKFPDRATLKINEEDGVALREGIGRYFSPVAYSTITLCIILIIGVFAPIIKRFDYVQLNVELFRSASYAILTALTLFQLWTVLISLGPAAELKNEADTDIAIAARQHNKKRLGSFKNAE